MACASTLLYSIPSTSLLRLYCTVESTQPTPRSRLEVGVAKWGKKNLHIGIKSEHFYNKQKVSFPLRWVPKKEYKQTVNNSS